MIRTEGSAESCDFGKHVLPYCKEKGERLFAYEYNGYWKDVGTLGSYWEANMELIDIYSGSLISMKNSGRFTPKGRYYPATVYFRERPFWTDVSSVKAQKFMVKYIIP